MCGSGLQSIAQKRLADPRHVEESLRGLESGWRSLVSGEAQGCPVRNWGLHGELLAQGKGLDAGSCEAEGCPAPARLCRRFERCVGLSRASVSWGERERPLALGSGPPLPLGSRRAWEYSGCTAEQEENRNVLVAMAEHCCAPGKPKTHPRGRGCRSLSVQTGRKRGGVLCGGRS